MTNPRETVSSPQSIKRRGFGRIITEHPHTSNHWECEEDKERRLNGVEQFNPTSVILRQFIKSLCVPSRKPHAGQCFLILVTNVRVRDR
mmetsp:Transcript_28903/g.44434  ORF Transcript_28903/g.44434 Transcript_28903/m.44434 type:complete len:89 (+) Transcript_28903:178-444(+)